MRERGEIRWWLEGATWFKGRIVHDAEGSGTGWKLAGEQGETEDVEEENDSDRNFKKRCFLEGRPHNRAA